jgi:hypothetical protein
MRFFFDINQRKIYGYYTTYLPTPDFLSHYKKIPKEVGLIFLLPMTIIVSCLGCRKLTENNFFFDIRFYFYFCIEIYKRKDE